MNCIPKILFFFFSLIATIATIGACNDDKEDQLDIVQMEISPSDLSFSSDANTKTILVTSNAEWGMYSSQSWCKISPGGGLSGTTSLSVEVTANSEEESRSAVLTFKSGSFRKEYIVNQNQLVEAIEFSDEAFKAYCINNFDANKDGIVSKKEVGNVTSINVQGLGISSMDGLESFVSLLLLNCSNNEINELNLSALTKLTSLNCSQNKLSELDISSNICITTLDCSANSSLSIIYVWTGFKPSLSVVKPDDAVFQEPEIPTPAGYSLVWQDEFNNALSNGKAVLPNTSDWWYETGNGGWGNNEIQNYISGFSGVDTCARISDGTLKIIAKKVGSQVLSVRMNTTKSWTYGYFEARLKLPGGKGTWPAFWMMPKNYTAWPDDGEIDIMEEVGYRPNWVSSSIHCKAYYHSIGTQKTAETYVTTAESEFHVYAVEWTEDFIWGYVDGVNYFKFSNDKLNNYDTWPFYNPFYLKLNLAWGGNWGGAEGIDESALPAVYEIDYVRVFQK